MPQVLTLDALLQDDGVASVLIQLLELEDKRKLRLVCHAGKDAVDKTVTKVTLQDASTCDLDYGHILVSSNWKGLKVIDSNHDKDDVDGSGPRLQVPGFAEIAAGGFSQLEELSTYFGDTDSSNIQQVIAAGWKLKHLSICGHGPALDWFGRVVKEAKWQLEELSFEFTDALAAIISMSDWPLKRFYVGTGTITPDGVAVLLQGSWMATIETLNLAEIDIGEKGARAIAEASHRALNLVELDLYTCRINNQEALILGEGSYPQLKKLDVSSNSMAASGLIAFLKKCPMLDHCCLESVLADTLVDTEDAKSIGKLLRGHQILDLKGLYMNTSAARALLKCIDPVVVTKLVIGEHEDSPNPNHEPSDLGNAIIAALVQHDWPCLKVLEVNDLETFSEGYQLFSRKKFPACEELSVYVWYSGLQVDPGLKLCPENLPKLKTLELDGAIEEAIDHIALHHWPDLRELVLRAPLVSDMRSPSSPIEWLRCLTCLNARHMPKLKELALNMIRLSSREQLIIKWAVIDIGGYNLRWI